MDKQNWPKPYTFFFFLISMRHRTLHNSLIFSHYQLCAFLISQRLLIINNNSSFEIICCKTKVVVEQGESKEKWIKNKNACILRTLMHCNSNCREVIIFFIFFFCIPLLALRHSKTKKSINTIKIFSLLSGWSDRALWWYLVMRFRCLQRVSDIKWSKWMLS